MKKTIKSVLPIIFTSLLISCNNSSETKKENNEIKSVYEKFDSHYDPNFHETSELIFDTIFKIEDNSYKLKIRMREDLLSRNIIRTYQCNKEGYLTTYGKEFILEFFTIYNSNESFVGRNYVNIDLIRKMDSRRQIEREENLYSFEGVNHIGSKNSNTIELNFRTIYAVGEGSNDLRISFDLTNTVDFCNIGGAINMYVSNPYD